MPTLFHRVFQLAAALGAFAWAGAALAQAYPNKPVRLVVGFAAGGSTDKLARVLAQQLGEVLNQTVVVENKPGAAGNLAAELVASAAPDGYTLFMATLSSQAINPHLYAKQRFDPIKSFEPITLVAKYPLLLVVPPQLQVGTVPELVAYAKANPGRTFFASSGSGSPAHLAGEIFKAEAKVEVRHVPYKGGGPAMMALMGNEAQFGFETIPSAIGHARSGKIKALAVTSEARSSAAPDAPTMRELGYPNFVVTSWAGLLAPLGTPKDVVARLNQAVNQALGSAAMKSTMTQDGAVSAGGTPADFNKFMADELKFWGDVVRKSGAKAE